MRVLVVATKGELGGAERWLLSVLDHAASVEACLVALERGPLVEAGISRGWPVSVRSTGRSPGELLKANRWLLRVVRDFGPDVILLNSTKAGTAVAPVAVLLRTPMVLVRHGAAFERTTRVIAALASACIVVSPPLSKGLPVGRTSVITPARPPVRDQPRPIGRSRPLILAMLCRLVPEKGIDSAIEALASQPDWTLEVGGSTEGDAQGELLRLEALASRLGVLGRVRFLGELDFSADLLGRADAAAVLTRPERRGSGPAEGFGLVVVEAAAAGIPVLADLEQVPSAVALGFRGVVPIDCWAPASVAQKLGALLDDEVRAGMGEQAREAVRVLHDEQQVSDDVVQVLRRACRSVTGRRSVSEPG